MKGFKPAQLFLLLLLLPLVDVAQTNLDFFSDTTRRKSITFTSNYNYGSSVMNNQFLNKFIWGGKIEREHKDKAYQNLSNSNHLGGDLNFRLNATIPIDTLLGKTNLSLVIGLEHVEHMDGAFSSDLFKFTFDGNKQFAGESIDVGGTKYNYFKYQQLNLGYIKTKKIGHQIAQEGVILSVIKAQEHQAISVSNGSIFTEQYGRSIDLALNYLYNSSDTASKGLAAFNGIGVSADLFTEFFLKNGDKVYLGLDDFGFIHWNAKSIEIAADSTFHFEGVEVDNIFDLNDSLLSNISQDSILNGISTSNEKKSYTMALPTAINIYYTKKLNEKWKISLGVYHKILSNYFPLISSNYYYYFNDKLVVKAHLSYGGYGKLNTGLAVAKTFGKRIETYIGTHNIEAFIVPESSYSNSGFIGIKAYF